MDLEWVRVVIFCLTIIALVGQTGGAIQKERIHLWSNDYKWLICLYLTSLNERIERRKV